MASVTSIYNNTQVPTDRAARETGERALGQKDFLQLLTAQLQNQDPFAPMENGEFLAQMAQFSTVQGIEDVNSTLSGISNQIGSNRIATGASLLGQQVLVPGAVARPDASGSLHGAVDLPDAATEVRITYTNAETGAVLHQQELGAQRAGMVGFSWDEVPENIRAARTPVRVAIETVPGATSPADMFVYAKVIGVDMPQDTSEMTLRVEDYGLRSSLEVTSIR